MTNRPPHIWRGSANSCNGPATNRTSVCLLQRNTPPTFQPLIVHSWRKMLLIPEVNIHRGHRHLVEVSETNTEQTTAGHSNCMYLEQDWTSCELYDPEDPDCLLIPYQRFSGLHGGDPPGTKHTGEGNTHGDMLMGTGSWKHAHGNMLTTMFVVHTLPFLPCSVRLQGT